MTRKRIASCPDELENKRERTEVITDFWNDLRSSDDSGSATWAELEQLERQVTECLARSEAGGLSKAERLTACAMMLMSGEFEI